MVWGGPRTKTAHEERVLSRDASRGLVFGAALCLYKPVLGMGSLFSPLLVLGHVKSSVTCRRTRGTVPMPLSLQLPCCDVSCHGSNRRATSPGRVLNTLLSQRELKSESLHSQTQRKTDRQPLLASLPPSTSSGSLLWTMTLEAGAPCVSRCVQPAPSTVPDPEAELKKVRVAGGRWVGDISPYPAPHPRDKGNGLSVLGSIYLRSSKNEVSCPGSDRV